VAATLIQMAYLTAEIFRGGNLAQPEEKSLSKVANKKNFGEREQIRTQPVF
jgi:hypothetical protein